MQTPPVPVKVRDVRQRPFIENTGSLFVTDEMEWNIKYYLSPYPPGCNRFLAFASIACLLLVGFFVSYLFVPMLLKTNTPSFLSTFGAYILLIGTAIVFIVYFVRLLRYKVDENFESILAKANNQRPIVTRIQSSLTLGKSSTTVIEYSFQNENGKCIRHKYNLRWNSRSFDVDDQIYIVVVNDQFSVVI